MPPILSILVVTFNHEREISDCIESIHQQCQIRPLEIIAIDNSSKDHTLACLESQSSTLKSESFEIRIIRNDENIGFTRAVNSGLAAAQGEFILLLNPDTVMRSGSLEFLVGFLKKSTSAGAAVPQLLHPNGEIQPSCRRFPRYRYILFELLGLSRIFPRSRLFNAWKMGEFDHRSSREVEQPQGACFMFPGKIFQSIGQLDPRFFLFFSDVDYCRRIISAGYRIHFLPEAKVMHRKGSSVYRNRPETVWLSHLDFIRYFLKWYRLPFLWILNIPGIPFLFLLGICRWGYYRVWGKGAPIVENDNLSQ